MRGQPRALSAAGLLAAAVLALGAWTSGRWAGDEAAAFVTAPVIRGDVEQAITALATLQPQEYVDVGAQASGQLRKIHVKPGAEVKQGDLLAEIDPALLLARVKADRAQLDNLRAQLAERWAQAQLADRVYQRQRQLMAARATSEELLQSAEAAAKAAEAQIAALQAQIQQTESTLHADETSLGYTRIYAPMSGTVVSLTARQGQTLNANQQAPLILRIADLSAMTVLAQVSEADVGRLEPGMEAYFTTLGRPDRRWHGTLKRILPTPEVINNVVLFNAQFDVPNDDRMLLPQMSAQVFFIQAAARDAVLAPVAALKGSGKDKARVQVARNGRIEEREVAVGVRNRVQAQILAGLSPGDEVVVGRRQDGDRASQPPRLKAGK